MMKDQPESVPALLAQVFAQLPPAAAAQLMAQMKVPSTGAKQSDASGFTAEQSAAIDNVTRLSM